MSQHVPLHFLLIFLGLAFFTGCKTQIQEIDNPYSDINWEKVHYLHSSTHQHGRPLSTPSDWHGRGEERLNGLYDQGLRHFNLSNYVPSVPVYPYFALTDFLEEKDDVIASPNAEHRTTTDFDMHFGTPGSYYNSGFARTWEVDTREAPYTHVFADGNFTFFDGLTVYDPDSELESDGAYRLIISLKAREGSNVEPSARITFEGIVEREGRSSIRPAEGGGRVENLVITHSYDEKILVMDENPMVHIEYDPETTEIERFRLTARTLIPWREAFSRALDGDRVNKHGQPIEGLQFEDGGGIIINHPENSDYESYLPLLDFDDRVLGMEVWNHRRTFGGQDEAPHDRYYQHWDNILSTGRRMYGFAVMDHRWLGRGRSLLLVPNPDERTREERKRDALRAYRQGQFFMLIGAIDTDDEGNQLKTGDYTEFRFTDIQLENDGAGNPVAVRASVEGHNLAIRPNVQIRFITEEGMEEVVNDSQARFELPRNNDGSINRKYVRIEAMAFPDTHKQGEPLTANMIEHMNVYDIAMLHDFLGVAGGTDYEGYERGNEPMGIVDMMFSQPIRFINPD